MCTVLLRFQPDRPWPLLVAAVRDEFLERPWDPPAAHWPDAPAIVGGRDRAAGGTWLAVRLGTEPAVAALLNGVRLPELEVRHPPQSRPASADGPDRPHDAGPGRAGQDRLRRVPSAAGHTVRGDRVELGRETANPAGPAAGGPHRGQPRCGHNGRSTGAALRATRRGACRTRLWSARRPRRRGVRGSPAPRRRPAGDDPRALVRKESTVRAGPRFAGKVYGSGSATLVAIAPDRVRYDFTATPGHSTVDPRDDVINVI